ncbi:MAG: helix-turn-helix domain-containing protein [Proteobacteria bacterium]|nr:helix-turn-helix domain-containing protein [Pseudomonadota bacterium]
MKKEKTEMSHDEFFTTISQFADSEEEAILTDPDAVTASKQSDESESSLNPGRKLRSTRKEKGFSIEKLSEETGIDRNLLAEVEAGEALLPLGQLVKLSKALSLRIADVISKGEEPFTVVRSDKREKVPRFSKIKKGKHGYDFESLASKKKDRKMEPFIVTLYPISSVETSLHDGQEFIFVLEGEIEVIIEENSNILGKGDAIYYDSTSAHVVKAHGDNPAKILAVLSG